MVELINYLIKELAVNQDAIEVNVTEKSEKLVYVDVKIAKEDMGKVIGKNGYVVAAIRNIIKSLSSPSKKYVLKIGEKEVE